MFNSTKEYFDKEWPDLAQHLNNNQSHFWIRVGNNTIPNHELAHVVKTTTTLRLESATYQAAVALMVGRLTEQLANPNRELFYIRGIGSDETPGCFICGGETALYHNIAAFVETKEAGERIVAMFSQGARLDFRSYEPDRIQVKIGACDTHVTNLQYLAELIMQQSPTITPEIIRLAMT